jgi:formylglycine-generating enzyme required for sulfatase activity
MRSIWMPLAQSVLAGAAAAALCAETGQVAASPPTTYRETVAGTLVTFEMVLVPAGKGIAPFYLGRTEVTWDLYDVFALGLDEKTPRGGADAVARPSRPYGAPDYGWGHTGYPAISIAREAAGAFAAWLSQKTGKAYRLPTEAEWEHAAILAADGDALSRLDAIAWYQANASGRTHPVASRKADALGLFDLFGNAAEWVVTADGVPVTRGGSFRHPRPGPTVRDVQDDTWNERDPQLPKSKWWLSDGPFVGFRLARSFQ